MVSRRTGKEAKSRARSSTTLSEVLIHEAKKERAARNTRIHKKYRLSPSLAKLIGSDEPETRYNVVKLIWVQIKESKLQDPEDPAYIDCGAEFEEICSYRPTHIAPQLDKLTISLAHHVGARTKVQASGSSGTMVSRRTRKEAKSRSRSSTTLSEVLIHEAKKKRAPRNSGIHKRYRLSPSLAKLIGSDEPETRYNVIKLIWIQIKERKLQDPEDPAYIDCDAEFEDVTGMVRLKGFTIIKYLNHHFLE
ncbi:uncharacterized protein LOC113375327 [Ctenocephalides felis]|uniref:uncharacterized protein LOC113375327 n=1 Tax=Ctenocephalides felis TaxID=7515 RepID=UPI000E6E4F17|nr:uncharacterized protein LOC113375327 [Ctenocephalides felis]